MKKYKVYLTVEGDFKTTVEAENEEEAIQIARDEVSQYLHFVSAYNEIAEEQ